MPEYDIVYDERGHPYHRAKPAPGLGTETYRTVAGTGADIIDALTGLPGAAAHGINYASKNLFGYDPGVPEIKGTSLGESVPQPWATGNSIIRSAAPMLLGGFGEAGTGGTLARGAPRVVKSAVDPAKVNDLMKPGMTRRDAMGKIGAVSAGAVATAAIGPKVLNELAKFAPEAKVAKLAPVAEALNTPTALHKAAIMTHSEAIDAHQAAIRLLRNGNSKMGDVIKAQSEALNKTKQAAEETALHPDYSYEDPDSYGGVMDANSWAMDAENSANDAHFGASEAPTNFHWDEEGIEGLIADHENAINSHMEAINEHDLASKNREMNSPSQLTKDLEYWQGELGTENDGLARDNIKLINKALKRKPK